MKNIVLIGMPSAGKSTIGVILAKVLGYQFIDTDLLIQEKEKRLLSEIITQEGLDKFIEIENQINKDLNTCNTVIATGGSVIYGKEAMEHLHTIGTIIYIKLSYDVIKGRLENIRQRGVVLRDNQNLRSLYEERCPLYEQYAHIIIDAEKLNLEETLDVILSYGLG